MGKLNLLLDGCRIQQFAVIAKLLHHVFAEMYLVVFFANVFLDCFEKLAIHLSSLQRFRTHFKTISPTVGAPSYSLYDCRFKFRIRENTSQKIAPPPKGSTNQRINTHHFIFNNI
ncbi:hypothetical protein ACOSP7_032762 [Xanthoceras sorbifolium]